jgi:hypothetical protein
VGAVAVAVGGFAARAAVATRAPGRRGRSRRCRYDLQYQRTTTHHRRRSRFVRTRWHACVLPVSPAASPSRKCRHVRLSHGDRQSAAATPPGPPVDKIDPGRYA